MKHKSKTSEHAKKEREEFSTYLDDLFDIKNREMEKLIDNCRFRSEDAKVEDKAFYESQKSGDKNLAIGKNDDSYQKKIEDKNQREKAKQVYADKHSPKSPDVNSNIHDLSVIEPPAATVTSDFQSSDPDFKEQKTNRRGSKPNTVCLEVPRDILRKIAITNARCGVGASSQLLTLGEIISQSGGSSEDFVMSRTSAKRC